MRVAEEISYFPFMDIPDTLENSHILNSAEILTPDLLGCDLGPSGLWGIFLFKCLYGTQLPCLGGFSPTVDSVSVLALLYPSFDLCVNGFSRLNSGKKVNQNTLCMNVHNVHFTGGKSVANPWGCCGN